MIKIDVEDLQYILKCTPSNQNILLCGKHGIGKSEIITHFYESKGMKVVPLFIGQMSDPGDIIGLPNKNEETGQTEFMLPYWFPVDNQPIVLFLDELNRARPELLQVVMDLVLNRKIAGKSLPEGSIIVSAINSGDEYTLTDLDPALISRFNVYKFEPSVRDWLTWAMRNGVNDYVIDFIASFDNMLDCEFKEGVDTQEKSYDRRSWKRLSDVINTSGISNTRVCQKMICGIIGDVAGARFFDHYVNGSIVKAEDIILRYGEVRNTLKNYTFVKKMVVIERLCAFIDREDLRNNPKYIKDVCVGNMKAFLGDLHREELGYMCSIYSTEFLFPNFKLFIGSNYELDKEITQFISSIEVV